MTGVTRGRSLRTTGWRRAAVLLAAGCALLAATEAGTNAATPSPAPAAGTEGGTDGGVPLVSRQSAIQTQLDQASADIEGETAASSAAHAQLASAQAQLPKASAALAASRATLATAQTAAVLAAAAVQADEIRLAEDRAAAAVTQQQVAADHARLDRAARSSYESGPVGLARGVLTATSPSTLVDEQAALRSFGSETATALADLKLAQAAEDAMNRRDTAAEADMKAQQARAVQAAADAAAAEAASESTAEQLQSLVHQRQQALAVVQSQLATDQKNYDELSAESDRIAALLQQQEAAQAAAAAAAAARTAGPGTAPAVRATPGATGLLWPTSGPVTSPFGYRVDPVTHERALHAGIDIGAPQGQPIEAAQAGTVVFAGQEEGYGNYTCIDHGGGFATCYAHQSAILVKVGQVVARGQEIGLVGQTGYATGPHLHFETRVNGTPVDPMRYF